ncbi:MAG: dipeptide epimerase [Kordiimonadaceae bacterium]|nr:dipeptide epimerase [Kordiimonadaceae bacterium]
MDFKIEKKVFPLNSPFVITGYTFNDANAVWVTINKDGQIGRGEANGIYYENETPERMAAQIGSILHKNLTHEEVYNLLPRGGARNALDCAFWDICCKKAGKTIWELLNIKPKLLVTVATISIDDPKVMAAKAINYAKYPNLKVKLSNNQPIERLEAIRAVRPDANLIVDINQGWTFKELKEYTPHCKRLGLSMIEQPLERGKDEMLEGYQSQVPLGSDESCLDSSEYKQNASRYDVINIKLDKCGGLTDALKIVRMAQRDNKKLMVGNMTGSSLSMAPSYVIGQFCQFIDIDGPLFLKQDIKHALQYKNGGIASMPTTKLWG